MGDWMDDDWDADVAPAASATAAGGGVPDSWADEDLSEEETPAEKTVQAPAPMKPSKARALAIKERERKEMEAAAAKRRAHEARLAEMSSLERKMEQQRLVEEADLDNARDLFGGGSHDGAVPKADTIDTMQPESDKDFDKLAGMIGDKCRRFNTNPKRTLRYLNFVKSVTRELTRDLGADDAKDLAAYMSVLSNEKLAASKRSKGGKKKAPSKKSHVKVDKEGSMGDGTYDDFDDFDGFM